MVKDIDPGPSASFAADVTDVNGTVYLRAFDGIHSSAELWRSDGTTAGTVALAALDPFNLTNVGGTLYFNGNDGAHGAELWKSDGTVGGTVMVKDINTGAGESFPQYLTNVNGTLYFTAIDGAHGNELWKSDGTAAGTALVKDIVPGPGSSNPVDLAVVNGAVEFYVQDPALNRFELWRSDGTAAGTIELAADIGPNTTLPTPLGVTAPPAGDFNRDFNADGFSDIQWHNNNGQVAIWEMNGTSQIAGGAQVLALNPGPGWNEIGAGDFNRDGHSDILWQRTNGQIAIWEMNGTNVIGGGTVSSNPGPSWKAVGTGDFNADGAADILFQNANGQAAIWEMNGTNVIGGGAVNPNPGPGWTAVGTGDFNGDGHSDILWQNASSGQTAIWEMNGTSIIGGGLSASTPARAGRRSEPAISTATAIPTSFSRMRATARRRSGR